MYLKQVVGGLRKVLFPDEQVEQQEQLGSWTFCGKAVNGKGGMPLCAEKMANKIFDGKANAHDIYLLQYLEEYYDVYPPENKTPHVTLTKWNITQDNEKMLLEFEAFNFGKKAYNATLNLQIVPTSKAIIDLDGGSDKIKVSADNVVNLNFENYPSEQGQDTKTIKVGDYRVLSLKGLKQRVEIPIDGAKVNNVKMSLISE